MYLPSHFAVPEREALHRLIAEQPLGALVTQGADGTLDANHLPFELDLTSGPQGTLRGHVARANPVWQQAGAGAEVLVIFRAGDAYISPSWYPSKHENHKSVPTWNYRVVHAHGRLLIRDDEKYVRGVVARLTRQHEATQPKPWRMTDAPPDYIATLLQAIVGIEVEITRLEGKFKLSQNRETRDIRGAAEGARQAGALPVSQAMLDAIPADKG